jgi:hypothetical protein
MLYIIRCQGLGYLTDRVYDGLPSSEDLGAALKAELIAHGVKDGKPRERWVRAEPIALVVGTGTAAVAADTMPLEERALVLEERENAFRASQGEGGFAVPEMHGVGEVKNPET